MPTYDYECDACGHKFEEFQSMSDKVLKKCPACKKPKLRRLFGTGAAVIFKGSGFYQTDYRSESYKAAAKADKEPESKPAGEKKDGSSKEAVADTAATSGASDTASSEKGGGKGKKSYKSKT